MGVKTFSSTIPALYLLAQLNWKYLDHVILYQPIVYFYAKCLA